MQPIKVKVIDNGKHEFDAWIIEWITLPAHGDKGPRVLAMCQTDHKSFTMIEPPYLEAYEDMMAANEWPLGTRR